MVELIGDDTRRMRTRPRRPSDYCCCCSAEEQRVWLRRVPPPPARWTKKLSVAIEVVSSLTLTLLGRVAASR